MILTPKIIYLQTPIRNHWVLDYIDRLRWHWANCLHFADELKKHSGGNLLKHPGSGHLIKGCPESDCGITICQKCCISTSATVDVTMTNFSTTHPSCSCTTIPSSMSAVAMESTGACEWRNKNFVLNDKTSCDYGPFACSGDNHYHTIFRAIPDVIAPNDDRWSIGISSGVEDCDASGPDFANVGQPNGDCDGASETGSVGTGCSSPTADFTVTVNFPGNCCWDSVDTQCEIGASTTTGMERTCV